MRNLTKFYHILLKMKLTLSLPSMFRILIMIAQKTLDLIYSANKNIKYNKIKDNLLRDMKNDVSEFIQNEIKQKLSLYIKEEDQAFVYKMIIVTLEKETKFLNSNTQKNNKDNIEGEKWTLVSHSVLLILRLFAVQASQETH